MHELHGTRLRPKGRALPGPIAGIHDEDRASFSTDRSNGVLKPLPLKATSWRGLFDPGIAGTDMAWLKSKPSETAARLGWSLLIHFEMSTERKENRNTATQAQDRDQTGKEARDEQSDTKLGGNNNLNENWRQTKDSLRKEYDQLTEEDLQLKPGHEQETIDRVGKRLKKTPQEAMQLVQDTARRFQQKQGNSAASTVGTHTEGTHKGHKDMPEAAEREARRNTPRDEDRRQKPQA